MSDGWKTVRIRIARYTAILARAKSEDISVSAWIDRALDAALSEANGSPRAIQAARDPVGSSDGEPVRAAAPRRASASPAMARQAKLNESKAKAKR